MPVRPEAAWEETPGAVALRVAARGVPRAQVDVFASDCFVKVRSVPAPAPRPRPPPPRRAPRAPPAPPPLPPPPPAADPPRGPPSLCARGGRV